jgi:putative DNA primase/helicase
MILPADVLASFNYGRGIVVPSHSQMPSLAEITAKLKNVKRSGTGFTAQCPGHHDHHNSLSVSQGDDGKILLHCHAGCETEKIVSALGLSWHDLFADIPALALKPHSVAEYDYCDENGELLFQTLRYDPKEFRQRRPDGRGGWVYNLSHVRRVLYRLPQLLAANPDDLVFVVEGEKDADNLARWGLTATTSPMGADHWRDEYAVFLRARHVVILPDNDDPGRKYARTVARSIAPLAASVKILELPDLPPKGDVSDWLDAGGSQDQLLNLAETARPFILMPRDYIGGALWHGPMGDVPVWITGYAGDQGGVDYFNVLGSSNALPATEVETAASVMLAEATNALVILNQQEATANASPAPTNTITTPANTAMPWLPLLDIMTAFSRGETGDAEILARLYADRIAYDHAAGAWYLWRSHFWIPDRTGAVGHFVTNDVASQYLYAAAEKRRAGANDEADDLNKRAHALRYRNKINNVLALAANQPALALAGDEWDSDLMLLGVANGTIDLRTGELRAGDPKDYIQMVAPTKWRGLDAPAPRWELFLQEIFAGDIDLIAFMQRLLGYGITGLTSEHVLPVLWGEGRNGKDSLLETLAHTLGAFASPVQAEVLLTAGRNPNAATPHLYALRGKRLVWVSETNEGARLNAGQVKLLTGGGTIAARPLYGKPITFKPQHLLMLVTNHKPHANADDYALWKRLLLIPFTQAFVDDPQAENEHLRDPHLLEKLKAEAPGILSWLVRGCLEWQRQGLNPPQVVRLATEDYREGEDTIGQFITERCLVKPEAQVKAGELYTAYGAWSKDYGMTPMSGTAFGKRISKRFEKQKGDHVIYRGIGLLA